MIDVKDEILDGEPRYNIRDNNGTPIQSNVQIELATPVLQPGTPINKGLFDSIKGDIDLVAKYNIPTVTTCWTEGTAFITSPFPTFSSTDKTDTTIDGYTITSNLANISGGAIFDKNDSTSAGMSSGTNWVQITFPETILLNPSSMNLVHDKLVGAPSNVSALKEDGTWVELATITSVYSVTTQQINNISNEYYKAFKIQTTNSGSPYPQIYELNLVSGTIKQQVNILNITSTIDTYENGMIVKINPIGLTEGTSNYININNLGAKMIDETITTLVNNKYYELVYDGTVFVPHLVYFTT